MLFRLWNNKKSHRHSSRPATSRSSARYGGMQVRELQVRMEIFLDEALSRNRSLLRPAQALAQFSLIEQKRFLGSVERISRVNAELAFQFCCEVIPALALMENSEWETRADSLLETLCDKGLDESINSLENFHSYHAQRTPDSASVSFNEISNLLNVYLQALSGGTLKLATSSNCYTDTETLYLPAQINHFESRDENFRLYKAMLVHQWAQTWFGTWQIDLKQQLQNFADKDRALRLFHRLETLRLDACVKRELPGMSRDMVRFRAETCQSAPEWLDADRCLQQSDASVQTSVECLKALYPLKTEPHNTLYQGRLLIEKTLSVIEQRRPGEKNTLQNELAKPEKMLTQQPTETQGEFNMAGSPQTGSIRLQDDAAAVEPASQVASQLNCVSLDHAEFPAHYLDNPETRTKSEPAPENIAAQREQIRQRYSYPEWDHSRQRYRDNWCLVFEHSVKPMSGAFVNKTLNRYRVLLRQLHRSFEAMRQQNLRLKREPFGDNLDIDSVVEAWVDTHQGFEASERLFMQTRRKNRNVAVMFMVDMSASTTGWINQVEREALVLLCETIERLGDRYAIYGFSGRGNRQCQSFHIKDFEEKYNDEVRGRIEGIQPQDYTRLGAAIRHLGARLSQVDAPTRLLITLSDGRPDDVDGYLGRYGIEDSRRAIMEIRHLGIHPYCITIDTNARDYISHMFGKHGFAIINRVEKLPARIAHIYRKLTT